MSEKRYVSDLHTEHRLWISRLLLAKDQLKSFQNRLQEVNAANTSKEIRAEIEKFQNQFISEGEVIDILIHDIHEDEFQLFQEIQKNLVASDHKKMVQNEFLNERMVIFNKIFQDLLNNFTLFLSKTL